MSGTHAPDTEIRPFRIGIPQASLDVLHERLARTRWTVVTIPKQREPPRRAETPGNSGGRLIGPLLGQ